MVVRGAPAIGCAAAYGVALEAVNHATQSLGALEASLDRAASVLAASRPTAVNLFWALERMARVRRAPAPGPGGEQSSMELTRRLVAEAERIETEDVATNRRMGRYGAALLEDGWTVLTHCNAGALATAGYGTALGVIRAAVEARKRIRVIAGETRPLLQGARLTSWELVELGIPVTLITDGMAGHLMQRGAVQAVVVGCDRVAANGDVVNKVGTYTVAVLAARHRIPFYAVCPTSTLDLETASGSDVVIEERDPDEVAGFRGVRTAPAGVEILNPAFDVTPAGLVTALVTDRGVVPAPSADKLRALLAAPLGATEPLAPTSG
jgi:methylthioribose-1-phosphate isomerase